MFSCWRFGEGRQGASSSASASLACFCLLRPSCPSAVNMIIRRTMFRLSYFHFFSKKVRLTSSCNCTLFFFRKRCVMTCSCDCIQRVCGERARLRVCVCGAGDGFRVSFLFAKFVIALYAYDKSRLFWWARTRQFIIIYQTSCFHGGCISLDELNYFGSAACRCCWLCVSWGVFSVCPVRVFFSRYRCHHHLAFFFS